MCLQCSSWSTMFKSCANGRSDWLSSKVGSVFSKGGVIFPGQPWSPLVSPAPGSTTNGECRRGGGKSLSSCRANLSGKVPNCKSSRSRTNNSEVRGYSLAPCLIWYTYSIFESFCWGVTLNYSIFHTWGIWVRAGRSLKPHAAELKVPVHTWLVKMHCDTWTGIAMLSLD